MSKLIFASTISEIQQSDIFYKKVEDVPCKWFEKYPIELLKNPKATDATT